MKVLFGAGNWLNSNIQLSRILSYNSQHEIKIAAFYRNHRYLPCIDWCLDPIASNLTLKAFKNKIDIQAFYKNSNLFSLIFDDVEKWKPDLVISDCELTTGYIAQLLKIPLWYCSSVLISEAINWKKHFNDIGIRHLIINLPSANRYLIYSPFGDIVNCPEINKSVQDKFYWVQPYSEIPEDIVLVSDEVRINDANFKAMARMSRSNSICLTSGETSFIADSLYSDFNIVVAPDPNDEEQCLNADLVEYLKVGANIGKAEVNLNYAKNKFDEYLHRKYNENFIIDSDNYNPQLHDYLGEYETSHSI